MNLYNSLLGQEENHSYFPSLTFQQRLTGFMICFFMGYFIQIVSFGSIFGVMVGHPEKFAIFYSLGNLVSLFGTSFIIGFQKQIENMSDKERRVTSIVFVGSLIFTIYSAMYLQSSILVIIFVIIQFCSYIWYIASYLPFARTCILSAIRGFWNR